MRIVLDTNILLISLSKKSKYRPIFDSLLEGNFELAISNEILSEYTEIIQRKTNVIIAKNVIELLLSLNNIVKTEVYFRWNLITADFDDNKFVDCAISSNAKLLVSNDKHFKELKNIDFPRIEVSNAEDFLKQIKNENL